MDNLMKNQNTQNIYPYGINELSDTLQWLDENVSWLDIAKQIGIEKQIEIRAEYRDWETDRKSTRLNSSHSAKSRMPSSA